MKYKIGTLEEYLIENPAPIEDADPSQKKKWQNPKKENEYLWSSDQGAITEDEKFNLVCVWTNSISGHTFTKYYINKNGRYTAGVAEVGQVMDTGLKNLEIFDDPSEWESRANELGIDTSDLGELSRP